MSLQDEAQDLVKLGTMYNELATMEAKYYKNRYGIMRVALHRSLVEAKSQVAAVKAILKAIIDAEEVTQKPHPSNQ